MPSDEAFAAWWAKERARLDAALVDEYLNLFQPEDGWLSQALKDWLVTSNKQPESPSLNTGENSMSSQESK